VILPWLTPLHVGTMHSCETNLSLQVYGSWRRLDDNEDSNYESWWSRDIRKIWTGGGKNNWFDKNIGCTRKKK